MSTRRRPPSPPCTPTPGASRRRGWPQVVEWYDELVRLTDNPVARLNRAVAVGEAHGPQARRDALAELDPSFPRHTAALAHLHERAGDLPGSARLHATAAELATSQPEREHLLRQVARAQAAAGGE